MSCNFKLNINVSLLFLLINQTSNASSYSSSSSGGDLVSSGVLNLEGDLKIRDVRTK